MTRGERSLGQPLHIKVQVPFGRDDRPLRRVDQAPRVHPQLLTREGPNRVTSENHKAIDISNWQGDLPQEVFHQWKAEGYHTVVLGTAGNPAAGAPFVADRQAAKAAIAGLEVELYIWLTHPASNDEFAQRVSRYLDVCDTIQVPRPRMVWLDCEDVENLDPAADVVGQIALARDMVRARGYEVGIYTGAWWWPQHIPNDTFLGIPKLWLAHYDRQPTLESSLLPLGEWTQLWRKQYTDQGTAGGVYPLDLNAQRAPAPEPAPEPAPVAETPAVKPMPHEVQQLHELAAVLHESSQRLKAAAGEIERAWR